MLAFGLAAFVVATARPLAPTIPAIAAPVAVAWPHGAPAVGAGVLIAATAVARPLPMPRLAIGAVLALGVWIGITGDGGLVRGAAACVAIAIAAPVCIRTERDFRLAAATFGLAAAAAALGAGLASVTGSRADVLAVSAALGFAASAGAGIRSIAAADLAGVLVLPSRAGVVAAGVALLALLVARRLTATDGFVAALATALAVLAGAPAAHLVLHGTWTASGYLDLQHRLGTTGVVLFALLLVVTLFGLPRMLLPAVFAVGAGAVFVPLEAAAPVWLFAGLAAGGASYHRSVANERERAARKRERELEAERAALEEEQRRLNRRRAALDEREAELNRPKLPSEEDFRREAALAEREDAMRRLEREFESRERALAEREGAVVVDEAGAEQRDWDLATRESAVREAESAFEARQRELEAVLQARTQRLDDRERTAQERDVELDERERQLDELPFQRRREREEWDAAFLQRQRELNDRAEALDERERQVARREVLAPASPAERRRRPWGGAREQAPPEPQPELAADPAPEPETGPPVEEPLQPSYQYWNVNALRRLVEKRLPDFPDRAEEWRSYLDSLAEQQVDGLLPPAFDGLITEVFAPILDARSA